MDGISRTNFEYEDGMLTVPCYTKLAKSLVVSGRDSGQKLQLSTYALVYSDGYAARRIYTTNDIEKVDETIKDNTDKSIETIKENVDKASEAAVEKVEEIVENINNVIEIPEVPEETGIKGLINKVVNFGKKLVNGIASIFGRK